MIKPNKPKVLVVEDEETFRNLHINRLSRLGYSVLTAETQEEAVILINRHFFHAAILDISLNVEDNANREGMEILELIHNKNNGTGIIMVTAFPRHTYVRDAFKDFNVVDFLDKATYELLDFINAAEKAVAAAEIIISEKKEAFEQSVSAYDNYFQQLASSLAGSGAMRVTRKDVSQLFKRLVKPMIPIVEKHELARIDEGDNETEKASPVFEHTYWSYFFGELVRIRIGQREQIIKEVEKLDVLNQLKTSGELSGYFQVLDNITYESFTKIDDRVEEVKKEENEETTQA